ncbi:MAG: methyltransferase domain-containing protein [bacterium]
MNERYWSDPAEKPEHNAPGPNHFLQEAFEAYRARRYNQAERLLRQAIAADSQAVEPRIHLANLLHSEDRYQEAVDILEPIKDDPAAREYPWFLFKARWNAGDYAAACEIIQTLIDRGETTLEQQKQFQECARLGGWFALARQLARRSRDWKSLRELRWAELVFHLTRWLPGKFVRPVFRWTAGRFERRGRWQRLRLLLEAARLADSSHYEWPLRLGRLCRQTRDVYDPQFARERMYYKNALRCRPRDPEAARGLILTLHDMGFWRELLRIIEQHSDIQAAGWGQKVKAASLVNQERYEEAVPMYTRLTEDEPEGFSRFCQGLIALQCEDWPIAAELFALKPPDRSLNILFQFFHFISLRLAAGEAAETIDGQEILDSISSLEMIETSIPRPSRLDACFLCGWNGPRESLWQDRTTKWIRVRCPRCSMISVAPIPGPDQTNALYTSGARREHVLQRQYKESVENLSQAREGDCRRLPLFRDITEWGNDFDWPAFERSLGEEKRFLDAGCSAGYAVLVFQRCGWRAMGLDIDTDAVAFGQARGIDVRVGTVDTLDSSSPRFDLITLIDIIEHVADPAALLRQCHGLLNPGGLLYVKTPCADSLPHRFIGSEWLEASEHLHFFSRATLRKLLLDTGYEVISFKQTMEAPTPFLHPHIWKERFYPECLERWMDRLRVGDTIRFLATKKP